MFWAFRRVFWGFRRVLWGFRRVLGGFRRASIAVLPERQAMLGAKNAPSAVKTSTILARLVLKLITVGLECALDGLGVPARGLHQTGLVFYALASPRPFGERAISVRDQSRGEAFEPIAVCQATFSPHLLE